WGIQFSSNISPAAFFINTLISPRAGSVAPGLSHADFALTVLRTVEDPLLFLDRNRLGSLIASVADNQYFAPAEDAVNVALDILQAELAEENIALAMAGYHRFFQRTASDADELADLIDALRKEATLATDPKRAAIAREMLMVGQTRLDQMTNATANATANAVAQSDYFRERITSPDWSPAARMLLAETILYESGDALSLPVHVAGWKAMIASMESGAVLPEQAIALLNHANLHAAESDFGKSFSSLATAWAERIHLEYANANPAVKPEAEFATLLNKLISLCVAAGNADELALLAAVPVMNADVHWLLTVLEHGEPKSAADYFIKFAPEFDLRVNNSDLSQSVFREDLFTTRLPQVLAAIDSEMRQWLLRVTLAALPDEALTSTASVQGFRSRENRLEKLAEQHSNFDFDQSPELEMAALRWFTEEYDVTLDLVQAFAKVGASIAPQEFISATMNPSLDGKRRIVSAWLRHSLSEGPTANAEYLDGMDGMSVARQVPEVISMVGALTSGLLQAFLDDASAWSDETRRSNLPLFSKVLARAEMQNFRADFLGRFAAAGLIYHSVDGEAEAMNTFWDEMAITQRNIILRGEDGFFDYFGYMMRKAMEGRKLDALEMEAATRGIHDGSLYLAMCGETNSGPREFFKDAIAARIITEDLLCEIGPAMILSNPRNGYAAEELAGVQEKVGQIDAALASWDVAIQLAPLARNRQYTKAFLAKAGLLERSGRFQEALSSLKELDYDRLDKSEDATFQNSLKELRILTLSEDRNASEMLRFAEQGLQFQPDAIQGRLSAAAVFRALRLKATAAGNDEQAWAFGFLAAHTLLQLERDEKDVTSGRIDSALSEFNSMHVGLGKLGGIVMLIPRGHQWKFTNIPQSPDWIETTFDDKGWPTGRAPLGYGSSDLRSVIDFGGNRRRKPVATFFRTTFTLQENETVRRIAFNLRRDDAAIVYLNGEEVRRDNLPDGTVATDTKATEKTSGSDETRYFPGPFSPRRLRPGVNTLAIAVHQYDRASSDLVFDAELIINDLGNDTALNAVIADDLRAALSDLWREVPASIRQRISRDSSR
ncbi:MAG: tetratricopeptide (TPR) repeat protein, partial [Verrucomicrobiales bacterium]